MKPIYSILCTATLLGALASCSTRPRACIEPSSYDVSAEYAIVFDNCSENSESYVWDFGDGTTSTDFTPVHVYNRSGEYEVLLQSYDKSGELYDVESVIINISSAGTHFMGSYQTNDHYHETTINGLIENRIEYFSTVQLKGERSFYISALNGYANVYAEIQDTNTFTLPEQVVFEDASKNIIHKLTGRGTFNKGFMSIDYNVEQIKGINFYSYPDYIVGTWKSLRQD